MFYALIFEKRYWLQVLASSVILEAASAPLLPALRLVVFTVVSMLFGRAR